MATNVFTKAKQLRKAHANKSWQELVKMAGSHTATKKSSHSKSTNMPVKRKRTTHKRKAVSGTHRPRKRTTTTRTVHTKRRSVGAIVDSAMAKVAMGMAIESIVTNMFIKPLRAKVPMGAQMFIDPALVIAGYQISVKAKSPVLRGVGLGIMKNGVDGTVTTLRAKLGGKIPGLGDMGTYYQLPQPTMGEIPQMLGEIPQYLAGGGMMNSNLPMMGDSSLAPQDQPYLPLGWNL